MTPAGKRILKAGIASAIGVAFLAGLGSWQLARLSWKEDLIARVAERMSEPPVDAPKKADWPNLDIGQWSYRRVRVAGAFDRSKEVRVFTSLTGQNGKYGGPGYFLLTPLTLADGGVVIVNRGFVPEKLIDQAKPAGKDAVTVAGPLRGPEERNMFTPVDQPEKRLFFDRDPKAIAAALGTPDAAPFTIDADATPNPGELPQGGETRVNFPNRHLEYALTWYGLAGTLFVMFLVFAWRTLREGRETRDPV